MADSKVRASAKRSATTWNREVSVGAPVAYRKDDGSTVDTHTRSPAEVLGGHTAVIWLENVRGCVALDRVTVRDRAPSI